MMPPVNPQAELLLREIRSEVKQTSSYTGREQLKPEVYAALLQVDRAEFVPEQERGFAWANHPLSIGQGQTISQPYIVALMTDLLDVDRNAVVLEIGAGCGYQADGSQGYIYGAPYDAIIVPAASEDVPAELLHQLKAGGRMVIPLGGQWQAQQLVVFSKNRQGEIIEKSVLPVAFVPLTGTNQPPESG